METHRPRSVVHLSALDVNRNVVQQREMSIDDYYGGRDALVDSAEYRHNEGIRWLQGKIYDNKGNLTQQFDVEYSDDGRYRRSRAVHQDGTVVEDS